MVNLRPVYTGDFCRGNFSRANVATSKWHVYTSCDFSLRFVAAISQGFRTCLKLDATLAGQKLHRVAATKIACVNGPLPTGNEQVTRKLREQLELLLNSSRFIN